MFKVPCSMFNLKPQTRAWIFNPSDNAFGDLWKDCLDNRDDANACLNSGCMPSTKPFRNPKTKRRLSDGVISSYSSGLIILRGGFANRIKSEDVNRAQEKIVNDRL